MKTRYIEVNLSDEAAERYDAAVGDDNDVLLLVEKAIMMRLYPGRADALARQLGVAVDTDPDLVAVSPGE